MSEKPEEYEEGDSPSQSKTLFDFLDKFDAEDYRVFVKEFKEIALETRKARLTERKTLSLPVFGLIAIIFIAIAVLAWSGRIEGHYVTSVGGVIAGYMMSFLEVSFRPSEAN